MIKIDKKIPIPAGGKERHSYPFADMKIGDSFAVDDLSQRASIANGTLYYGRKLGFKFSIRKVDNKIRCWRIK